MQSTIVVAIVAALVHVSYTASIAVRTQQVPPADAIYFIPQDKCAIYMDTIELTPCSSTRDCSYRPNQVCAVLECGRQEIVCADIYDTTAARIYGVDKPYANTQQLELCGPSPVSCSRGYPCAMGDVRSCSFPRLCCPGDCGRSVCVDVLNSEVQQAPVVSKLQQWVQQLPRSTVRIQWKLQERGIRDICTNYLVGVKVCSSNKDCTKPNEVCASGCGYRGLCAHKRDTTLIDHDGDLALEQQYVSTCGGSFVSCDRAVVPCHNGMCPPSLVCCQGDCGIPVCVDETSISPFNRISRVQQNGVHGSWPPQTGPSDLNRVPSGRPLPPSTPLLATAQQLSCPSSCDWYSVSFGLECDNDINCTKFDMPGYEKCCTNRCPYGPPSAKYCTSINSQTLTSEEPVESEPWPDVARLSQVVPPHREYVPPPRRRDDIPRRSAHVPSRYVPSRNPNPLLARLQASCPLSSYNCQKYNPVLRLECGVDSDCSKYQIPGYDICCDNTCSFGPPRVCTYRQTAKVTSEKTTTDEKGGTTKPTTKKPTEKEPTSSAKELEDKLVALLQRRPPLG